MYEIFKDIAAANNYIFDYGRTDFHNLFDGADTGQKLLFVDPISILENLTEEGVLDSYVYSGMFLLMVSSGLDELSYQYRKENYIDPLKNADLKIIKDTITCTNLGTIKRWKLTEVINMFNWNADGWMIEYEVHINV